MLSTHYVGHITVFWMQESMIYILFMTMFCEILGISQLLPSLAESIVKLLTHPQKSLFGWSDLK